jgi:hypothetical protein
MQPEILGNFDTSATDDWREVLGHVPELIWAVVSRRSDGLAPLGGDQPVKFLAPQGRSQIGQN